MRITSGVIAFAVLLTMLSRSHLVATAKTYDTKTEICATTADLMDDYVDMGTNGSGSMNQSWKDLENTFNTEKTFCRQSDPHRGFITAMLMVWTGWLVHYERHSNTDLEQGIQLLTLCAAHYFGTHEGAICSQWQEKAIRWKMGWESSSSP